MVARGVTFDGPGVAAPTLSPSRPHSHRAHSGEGSGPRPHVSMSPHPRDVPLSPPHTQCLAVGQGLQLDKQQTDGRGGGRGGGGGGGGEGGVGSVGSVLPHASVSLRGVGMGGTFVGLGSFYAALVSVMGLGFTMELGSHLWGWGPSVGLGSCHGARFSL